jgi:hypothetical protein
MKTYQSFLSVTLGISLAALAAQTSFAQAPTGSITNVVTSHNNVLWDATLAPLETINLDLPNRGSSDTNDLLITFDDPYTQDGKGKLAGTGATQITATNGSDITLSFPGTYVAKGTIKGNNGLSSVKFSSKATGTANIQGADRTLNASAAYTITLDANAGTATGRLVGKAAASGVGSTSGSSTFSDSIPAELGDGSWTLVLNFGAPVGTKLAGTATVTLATGQVYPFNFTGTFVASTAQSKLSLKGVDAGLGSVLSVTLHGSTVFSIKGKVAGQVINL